MPRSEPWCAPEFGDRQFRPLEAKRMDIYSFAMLCAWLLFGAGISMDLPLPPETAQEIGQFISFEPSQSVLNLLQLLKSDRDNKLAEWITWLIHNNSRLERNSQGNLSQFFRSTLAFDPKLRCTEFGQLLNLLIPNQ